MNDCIKTKLEKAKEVINAYIGDGDCGIFNCRNVVGDEMTTIYADGELTIDICYHFSYFEVFGLSREEFSELEAYYDDLVSSNREKIWKPEEKPPLGLTPIEIWKDMRIHDIVFAIERYANAKIPIPIAWANELEALLGIRNDCEAKKV